MKRLFKLGLAFFTLTILAFGADKIRVGTVPGAFGDSVEAAAQDAKKYGIEVEVIEFTDWTTPNIATDKGDIDINYFQHEAFLSNAIEKNGYKLTPIGYGTLPNIGLYLLKHKSFDAVPKKGNVGIPNDPINQARGLSLLQKAGLIKLKNGGTSTSTLDDIIENPKQLRFTEVPGIQLVRTIREVDLAVGYPDHIVASGAFNASDGLIWGGKEDKRYAILFVAQTAKKDDPVLRKFVEIYQNSEGVREAFKKGFNNDPRLYTLTWLEQ
jgi:D-methionine transport system substrate-binding protein